MSRFFLLALGLMLCSAVDAAPFNVKGVVRDSLGTPEPYATVRLFLLPDTIKPVSVGVTDESGAFERQLDKAGDYKFALQSVGRKPMSVAFSVSQSKPTADLGELIVADDNMLAEVTVEAVRPIISKEIDRIGYDVQADEESKTSMLDEMLRKVPLVSVDDDGTIKVNGSTSFKVYKNGRPNNSFTSNAKDIFKAIPASSIKKIEVITEPGAREDAEGVGAILNIVTVQTASMKGAMGNVGLNYDTNNDMPSPNLWLSTQVDKLSLSLYGGMHRNSKRQSENRSDSKMTYDDSGNTLSTESSGHSKGWFGFWGIEGSYDIDSLNLVTVDFGGFGMSMSNYSETLSDMTSPDGNLIYHYGNRSVTDPSRSFDIYGGANYQHSTHRKGETYTLSYRLSTTSNKSKGTQDYFDMQDMPVDYTGIFRDTKLDFAEHTIQADWTRPFNDIHTVDVGGKYIYRDNHSVSDQDYFNDRKEHTDFKHVTQVGAVYGDYRVKLGRFGLRGGVRYEYSRLSAKYRDGSQDPFSANLNDWVPNASFMWDINPASSLKLSFASRISRPGIDYLNPTVNTDPNSTSTGNPDLESVRNNSLSLNYTMFSPKTSLNASASYSETNNGIIAIQEVVDDHIYNGYANAGKTKSLNLSVYTQIALTPKTSFMLNASTNYNRNANPNLKISNSGWSFRGFMRIMHRLPYDMSVSLMGGYWSGDRSGLYNEFYGKGWNSVFSSIGLNKSFLKDKRLTVNLSVRNPLHPSVTHSVSKSVNTPYYSESRNYRLHNRSVMIGVSYRFGSMNVQVKKVNKGITNDDVIGGNSAKDQNQSSTSVE